MATDGLFDNVEVEDIASICLEWEQTNGFIRGGDICARDRRWSMGNSLAHLSMERIGDLADALCQKARMNSINSDIDSPFAILAKENDVMWYVFFLSPKTLLFSGSTRFLSFDCFGAF